MAKVTVYIPDRLHRRLKEQRVPITKTCQAALAETLDQADATIATQLRRACTRIEAIAQEMERRTLESYERMVKALGLETVEEMLADTAYLKDRHAALRKVDG